MKKHYSNGEITVVWNPGLCVHSENCIKGLPGVFDVSRKPWIDMDGASSEQIVTQVGKCPSGALSILEQKTRSMEQSPNAQTKVEVFKDGPVKVTSPCTVVMPDGTSELRERDIFLCRCGHSSNKPYCDGSHKKAGFTG